MKASHRVCLLVFFTLILLLFGCSQDLNAPADLSQNSDVLGQKDGHSHPGKAQGCLQIDWPGGNGSGAPTDERLALVSFKVREANPQKPDRGFFKYEVFSADGTPHRKITVDVDGVVVDRDQNKVWFRGIVVSDSKGCEGAPGGGGGHDSGCSGDDGDTCSDEGHDTGHDGGCSGTHDEDEGGGCSDSSHVEGGGCSGSHDEDDGGGCSGSHDEDDGGGCSGEDHDDEGNEGGSGGPGGPPNASGKYCRVGQVLVAKGHDAGSPGVEVDGITWKWFLADNPNLPAINNTAAWTHLCRKTITTGGLFIPGGGHEGDNGDMNDLCADDDDGEEDEDPDCGHEGCDGSH